MSVFERVVEVMAKTVDLNGQKVELDSHLENDLNLDSLDRVELMIALEEEFSSEIPDDKAQGLSTVRQIVEFIENG